MKPQTHSTQTTDPRPRPQSKLRLAFILMSGGLLLLPAQALRAQSPFDGLDLGTLDPGSLVVLHDDPIAIDALDVLSFELPLDLSGADPVAVLRIDPDGDPTTDNSFALPIQLGDQLVADPESLLAEIGLGDDILSPDDLDLIPGLVTQLNGITGNLLSVIFGLGNELSIADITDDLNGAVIEAIGIDVGGLTGYILGSTLHIVGVDNWIVSEVEAAAVQPDITVGRSANRNTHVGDNQYSGGVGQTMQRRKSTRKVPKAFFTFQNDGNATDTFGARSRSVGTPQLKNRVLYRGANVTAAMQSGAFRIEEDPGEIAAVTVVSSESRKAKKRKKSGRSAQTYSITLRSTSDTSKFDEAEVWTSVKPKRKRR